MNAKELTVLMVEPGKHPKVTKLKDDLDSLQRAVSIGADYQGLIEFVSLGNGDCIMCNEEGNGIDFMYEAMYHIRYRQFSENVSTHNELLLTLLIEDELCRCGYAFRVWSLMKEFTNVYKEILRPYSKSRGWRAFCPWHMEMYLAGNMANRIMLKNKRPIDWGDELDCDRATFPYSPDYMKYRITVYEQAMGVLFPESDQWYEEWTDGQYIAELIKDRYQMDFTKDPAGYDNLIGLVVERKFPRRCSICLYRLDIYDIFTKKEYNELMDYFEEKMRNRVKPDFGTNAHAYFQTIIDKEKRLLLEMLEANE